MKNALAVIALALLAWFAFLGVRPEAQLAPAGWDTARGPWFEVHVVKPRMARPLGGLVPEDMLGLPQLVFHHASPGAEVIQVGEHRLELHAEGWELLIETDDEGNVAPGTRVVFPIELANRQRTLRARPADPPVGSYRTTTGDEEDVRDGEFLIELPLCEDAGSGKLLDWPSGALSVRGRFVGLARGPR